MGSGNPTSIKQLIETMERVIGKSINVRYDAFRQGEVKKTWCDIEKARNVLGFNPGTTLEEGLRKTWQWFQEVR